MDTLWIKDELSEYPYNRDNCTESIEVELSDEDYLELCRMAQERDISFNHLLCAMIDREVRRQEQENSAKP